MHPIDHSNFKNLSKWDRELAELDRRIALKAGAQLEWVQKQTKHATSVWPPPVLVWRSSGLDEANFEPRRVAESLRDQMDKLLPEYRRAFLSFAEERIRVLDDLSEESQLGGLSEQCGFVVAAILDACFAEFREALDRHNTVVSYLLEFCEPLEVADQSNGGQEPIVGLGVVRLAEEMGAENTGIRIGSEELKFINVDGACRRFISDLLQSVSSLLSQICEREIANIEREAAPTRDECEYVFGDSLWKQPTDDVSGIAEV